MPNPSKGAIVGLGITPMGKIYGRRSVDFAAEAIALALDDAGLQKSDIDGLLINANIPNNMDPRTQMVLGSENLNLINVMTAYGSTASSMNAVCLHGDPRESRKNHRSRLRRRAAVAVARGPASPMPGLIASRWAV
jgi:hypothetical protein